MPRFVRPLALVLVACCLPGLARADDDPWFGRDKAKHFAASAVLASGGYAAGSIFFEGKPARLATGAGLALSAGIAKELYDLAGYGHPSWRDLAWDAIGTGAGLLLAFGVDSIFFTPAAGAGSDAKVIGLRGTF